MSYKSLAVLNNPIILDPLIIEKEISNLGIIIEKSSFKNTQTWDVLMNFSPDEVLVRISLVNELEIPRIVVSILLYENVLVMPETGRNFIVYHDNVDFIFDSESQSISIQIKSYPILSFLRNLHSTVFSVVLDFSHSKEYFDENLRKHNENPAFLVSNFKSLNISNSYEEI